MTRPLHEWERVQQLIHEGLNDCQIARLTGINRSTIREWRRDAAKGPPGSRPRSGDASGCCPICEGAFLDPAAYAYLLGLYLGDGYIVEMKRGVYRLRVFLDQKYPGIIRECKHAIEVVRGGGRLAGIVHQRGCDEVSGYWKHWPCLFPQHGPGPKHSRRIELRNWQKDIVGAHAGLFLRGLIHSDGCRNLNPVNGKNYPRYQFSNVSEDIRDIFCTACDDLGIHWRKSKVKTVSVARRRDVEILDRIIGPKR